MKSQPWETNRLASKPTNQDLLGAGNNGVLFTKDSNTKKTTVMSLSTLDVVTVATATAYVALRDVKSLRRRLFYEVVNPVHLCISVVSRNGSRGTKSGI